MPTRTPAGTSTWTNPDDAPPLTDAFFDATEFRDGIHRGRPASPAAMRQGAIGLDPDLLDRPRATAPDWQTRLSEAIRDWLRIHAT